MSPFASANRSELKFRIFRPSRHEIQIRPQCWRSIWRFCITLLGVIAGLSAIGIAIFPMDPTFGRIVTESIPALKNGECLRDGTCYFPHGILGLHLYFVATFFTVVFVLMWFRFSAFTPTNPTPQKRIRNKVYRICAIVMAASGVAMWWFSKIKLAQGMFWSESLAVMAFAGAWLVKGQLFLRDRRKLSTLSN
ncbi:hypothetical protein [Nitrogeniibacter aestuarii]|uniref:hypothetical protein n=1 Tax=Nitrogeniibacter aestuarii TaxID=2815343 RepID=UPI001E4CD298|nr:hypothetical protein [Nitrogeniibacter aestuarii]